MRAPIESELAAVTHNWDLLQHPFYRRWAAGEVSRSELAYYACQYAHVVARLPRWLENAADRDSKHAESLRAHAAQETDHVKLWARFAESLGVDETSLRAATPNAATAALLRHCDELVDAGQGAPVVWALEAQSPATSAEKLRGLRQHYGIDATSGAEYFALHQTLDREHEAQLRDVIARQPAALVEDASRAAATVIRGMWALLGSIQEAA